jgi:Fe-S oxidoreductase
MREAYLAEHPEIAARAAERRAEAEAAPQPEPEGHPEVEVGVTYGDELPELEAHSSDMTGAEIDEVVDLCFQCKLCYPNCPYTPPHEFALDFPRLLLRWKAQRVRREGVPLRTRLMRDTELIGKASSAAAPVANAALRHPLVRGAMESTIGIHRDKLMPTYHSETFPAWWKKHRPQVEEAQPLKEGVEEATPLKVVLFSTCLIDYNDPAVGRAAVQVLEHCGVAVTVPQGQGCCGMPFLDGGDLDAAAAKIKHNVALLYPYVERGYRIVIPSPSCSLMTREEYPQIVSDARSAAVAAATHDLDEYLYRIAREGRLKRDFKRKFGPIRYHVPCHIRAQNVGIRGRDLLKLVADDVTAIQECTGHDGTWSMHKDNFEDSLRWGKKAFDGMRAEAGEACALACTDCRLAALHIEQGADRKTVHPVVALAHAYGFDVGVDLESKPV